MLITSVVRDIQTYKFGLIEADDSIVWFTDTELNQWR